jgi:serine/threonine protein kinase
MPLVTKPPRTGHVELANTLRSIDPALTPHAPEAPSRRADAVPVRTDRYTLGGLVDIGASSTIVHAFDALLHRPVALKVLHPALASDPEARRRFLENAKATGELDHAGIVPVHDIGELPDGRTFVAMRLFAGKSLIRVLDELRGTDADPRALLCLLRTFLRVCETVAYAHGRGVIHRDLQPSGVLIGEFGEAIVLDWGLFKWNPIAELRREGLVAGGANDSPDRRRRASAGARKPARSTQADSEVARLSANLPFMSPEQVNGEGLDTLTDVYGLGAVLYALACGEAPVEGVPGEPLGDLVERVRSARRPLPSERREATRAPRALPWRVPSAIDAICARALSISRERRHPSVAALIAELALYLDGRASRDRSSG